MVGFKPRTLEPRAFLGGLADATAAGYQESTRDAKSEKLLIRIDPRHLLGYAVGRQKLLTLSFNVSTGYMHIHPHDLCPGCRGQCPGQRPGRPSTPGRRDRYMPTAYY